MTGMREQEVMYCYWSDINFNGSTARVSHKPDRMSPNVSNVGVFVVPSGDQWLYVSFCGPESAQIGIISRWSIGL
jgi:hypothetical protein